MEPEPTYKSNIMNIIKSFYHISQPVSQDVFLYTNFKDGKHILLSKEVHNLLEKGDQGIHDLYLMYPEISQKLYEEGFLIKKDINDLDEIKSRREKTTSGRDMYHVIVNPTLDCNLSCWYCYEHKIAGSAMSDETVNAVCLNFESHFKAHPYKLLKLSFFGGEPFLRQETIKKIVEYANYFCLYNDIGLLLDFTSNGVLITESMLHFLKDYSCMFQITLDGNHEQHNKIKFTKSNGIDAFLTTINNIHRIQNNISNSLVHVRINFDSTTLNGFDEILERIIDLDRKRTKIILKKIWQVDSDIVSSDLINDTLNKLFDHNFQVDYYSQGGICFADRENQATINYDGNVFKCTTITDFNKENALGYIMHDSGEIIWVNDKIAYLHDKKIQNRCLECVMLPYCGGPCRRKVSGIDESGCFLDDINTTVEEFARIQFKIKLTNRQIFSDK